jgi:hypothetical protein
MLRPVEVDDDYQARDKRQRNEQDGNRIPHHKVF